MTTQIKAKDILESFSFQLTNTVAGEQHGFDVATATIGSGGCALFDLVVTQIGCDLFEIRINLRAEQGCKNWVINTQETQWAFSYETNAEILGFLKAL